MNDEATERQGDEATSLAELNKIANRMLVDEMASGEESKVVAGAIIQEPSIKIAGAPMPRVVGIAGGSGSTLTPPSPDPADGVKPGEHAIKIMPGEIVTVGPTVDEVWGGRAPWMHVPVAAGADKSFGGIGREQWMAGPVALAGKIIAHFTGPELGAGLFGGVIVDSPWGRDTVFQDGTSKFVPSFGRLWEIRKSAWGEQICGALASVTAAKIPLAIYLGSPWADPRLKTTEGAAILRWVCRKIRDTGCRWVIMDQTSGVEGTDEAIATLDLITDECGIAPGCLGIEATPMLGAAFDHLRDRSALQTTWFNRRQGQYGAVLQLEQARSGSSGGDPRGGGQRAWLLDGGGDRPDVSMDGVALPDYCAKLIPFARDQGAHAVFAPWGIRMREVLAAVNTAEA